MEIRITEKKAELNLDLSVEGVPIQSEKEFSHDEIERHLKDSELSLSEVAIDTKDGLEVVLVPKNPDLTLMETPDENRDSANTGPEQDTTQVTTESPPVPDLIENKEEYSNDDLRRYEQLQNKSTQAHMIRKILFQEGEMTRGELKEKLHDSGYDKVTVGESHSGVNSTLRVLDQMTNEIDRKGRGEEKQLIWSG